MRSTSLKVRTYTFLYYFVLVCYAFIILYPLFFTASSSLKSNDGIFVHPFSLPQHPLWSVYPDVLIHFHLARDFLNSLLYTVVAVAVTVVVCLMASYALVRMKWRLSALTMGFFLLGLMVPVHAIVVPLFILLNRIGITSQRFDVISIYIAFSLPVTILILSAYLRGVPREYEEAAVIDGSSLVRAFWSVIVPVVIPSVVTVTIFNFLSVWNDFFISFIFINSEDLWTIQLGLSQFRGGLATAYGDLLAGVIVASIPTVIVYLVLSRRLIRGFTAGAIKQ